MQEMNNERIYINEKLYMCSGVCCGMRDECWRYRMNKVLATFKQNKRKAARFLEPAYNGTDCPFFVRVQYALPKV